MSDGDHDNDDKVIPKLPDLSEDLETLLGSGAPVEPEEPK